MLSKFGNSYRNMYLLLKSLRHSRLLFSLLATAQLLLSVAYDKFTPIIYRLSIAVLVASLSCILGEIEQRKCIKIWNGIILKLLKHRKCAEQYLWTPMASKSLSVIAIVCNEAYALFHKNSLNRQCNKLCA